MRSAVRAASTGIKPVFIARLLPCRAMSKPLRILPLLAAAAALPFTFAACGGDSITKTEFDHWMKIAAISQQQQTGATGAVTVPDAPDFKACIAAKKKTAKPAKGQPVPNDASYKGQCQTEYNGLRDQVMSFLINYAWIQGESAEEGIKYTDAQTKAEFDKQRNQSFPKDKDYLAFLKSSGYVQEDLLYRIRMQSLGTKLRDKIIKGSDKVSDAAIAAYYNKNKARFAVPEKRDIRIVLTKDEAQAKAAKKALDEGQSWSAVAKKYSTDAGTKNTGGLLSAVPKGQQEKALDDATFAAKQGVISGPVKTQFGYYVFEVAKITPGSQQTLDQEKESIRQLLSQQQQQDKLNAFIKTFEKKWKDRTDCRKGYVTQDCSNAPKTSTATTATPGAATQNAAPADSSASTSAPATSTTGQ